MVAAKETTSSDTSKKTKSQYSNSSASSKKGSIITTWELSPDAHEHFHKEFENYKTKHPDKSVPFEEYIETVIHYITGKWLEEQKRQGIEFDYDKAIREKQHTFSLATKIDVKHNDYDYDYGGLDREEVEALQDIDSGKVEVINYKSADDFLNQMSKELEE